MGFGLTKAIGQQGVWNLGVRVDAVVRLGLAILAVLAAFAFAGPEHAEAQQVAPYTTTEIEARKQRALARIESIIVSINAAEREALRATVLAKIDEGLTGVRAAYDRAKANINETVGFWDAVDREALQTKIDEAITKAEIQPAIEAFVRQLTLFLAEAASDLYVKYNEQILQVLREEIFYGLDERLAELLFEQLVAELERDAVARLEGGGDVGDPDGGDFPIEWLAAGAAIIAIRRLVLQNLGRVISRRLAGTIIWRALGNVAAAFGLSPGKATGIGVILDIIVAIGAAILTLSDIGATVRGEVNKALDKNYEEQIVGPLKDPKNISLITGAIVDSVQSELRKNKDFARRRVEETYSGLVIQANSPGIAEFTKDMEEEEVRALLLRVSSVFGRRFGDVTFEVKVGMIDDIGPELTIRLLEQYGQAFIDLYTKNPQAVADLARSSGDYRIFSFILSASDQEGELRFFVAATRRFGPLIGRRAAAVLLVRRAIPNVFLEDVSPQEMAVLQQAITMLERLYNTEPALTTTIINKVVTGDLGAAPLRPLLEIQDPQTLAAMAQLLIDIGGDAFVRVALVATPEQILDFVREFGAERSAEYLASPAGPSLLRIYARPDGGGRRAVRVYFRLSKEYGSDFSPQTERIVTWVLTRSGIEEDLVTRDLIENLRALGIPGAWPDFVAKPLAWIIAHTGLIGPFGIFGAIILLPIVTLMMRIGSIGKRRRKKDS